MYMYAHMCIHIHKHIHVHVCAYVYMYLICICIHVNVMWRCGRTMGCERTSTSTSTRKLQGVQALWAAERDCHKAVFNVAQPEALGETAMPECFGPDVTRSLAVSVGERCMPMDGRWSNLQSSLQFIHKPATLKLHCTLLDHNPD